MATRQQLFSPFGAFVEGKSARQAHDYGQTRNALADLELQDAPQQMQRRNALADVQLQGAQANVEGAQQQLGAEKAKIAYAKLRQAADSGDPKAFIMQQIPDLAAKLQEQGIDLNSMDGQSVAELTENLARKYAGEAGIAPTAQLETLQGEGGSILQRDPNTGELKQVVAPQRSDPGFVLGPGQTRFGADGKPVASVAPTAPKPTNTFRAMTPQEITSAGLPAGTSAQVDEATGKIDVLSKKDASATLSQKDATAAKLKLTTIRVARKQLQDIKAAFDSGTQGNLNAFGPAQGYMPTQQGKKFDAAVDRMRSTLTALTRTPGVGAMSDYETKLDQSKFPKREAYESVTAEQIQGIEDLLSTIETGYAGLLSGESAESTAAPAAPQPQATPSAPRRVKVDAQGNVIGN